MKPSSPISTLARRWSRNYPYYFGWHKIQVDETRYLHWEHQITEQALSLMNSGALCDIPPTDLMNMYAITMNICQKHIVWLDLYTWGHHLYQQFARVAVTMENTTLGLQSLTYVSLRVMMKLKILVGNITLCQWHISYSPAFPILAWPQHNTNMLC